jgi:methylglutamate dehydrogenase subunit D
MPSFSLVAQPSLEHPPAHDWQGLTLSLPPTGALAFVGARKCQAAALAQRVLGIFRIALPQDRRRVDGESVAFVWAGLGQWIAMAEREQGVAFERRLRENLGEFAAISDQSDARIQIHVSGINARAVLAKGVPIDLHPRTFRTGDVAITTVAHIGALFWQVDDAPTYAFLVPRSFAESFRHWLIDSAAEFRAPTAATTGS